MISVGSPNFKNWWNPSKSSVFSTGILIFKRLKVIKSSLLNLDEEEISISEAEVAAVQEEIPEDDIINDFGLSLHTSPFDIDSNSEKNEKSYYLGDTISVRVEVQKENPYYM